MSDDPGYYGRPVDDPDGEAAALDQEHRDALDEARFDAVSRALDNPEVAAGVMELLTPDGHPTGGRGRVMWGEPGHVPFCGCRDQGATVVMDDRCTL